LHSDDNVLVLVRVVAAGEEIGVADQTIRMSVPLPLGHKIAACPIEAGAPILKYGVQIGTATRAIAVGEHVHLQNMRSNYLPTHGREEAGGPHA